MKAALLGGALAFALWGAPALAGGDAHKDQVGQRECPPELIGTAECPEGVYSDDVGLGGSGEEGQMQDESLNDESLNEGFGSESEGLGGSGDTGTWQDDSMSDPNLGTDPSLQDDGFSEEPVGGAADEGQPAPAQPDMEPRSDMWVDDRDTTITTVTPSEERRESYDARGLTVLLGGGVEGYTGALAPEINPGPQWGVGAAFKPTKNFGLELGYSGAVNNLTGEGSILEGSGANITRHGGSAVATLGLTSAAVQPYLLGGVGVDRYIVDEAEAFGYQTSTIGNVPVGVGLRTHVGNFTADLRGNYGILFEQDFAPGVGGTDLGDIGDSTPSGRYGATLRLGATF